jgi:hypothetical protein
MRYARQQSTITTDDARWRSRHGVAGYCPSLTRAALPASDLFPLHNPAPTSGPRTATPGTPSR